MGQCQHGAVQIALGWLLKIEAEASGREENKKCLKQGLKKQEGKPAQSLESENSITTKKEEPVNNSEEHNV